MGIQHLALLAVIALGRYQGPQAAARARIDPRAAPVLVQQPVVIQSVTPSRGCQGAKDLTVTVKGQGFGTDLAGVFVYIDERIRSKVLAVRPESIDVLLSITEATAPGPYKVVVNRKQNGSMTGTLENGFTVSAGVDLTLETPTRVSEPARLVLEVPVKNIGCATSEPTIVLGMLRETEQRGVAKVPAMAAGTTQVAHVVFPLVEGQAAFDAHVVLTVDQPQQIVESDETNNQVVWVGPLAAVPLPAPIVEPRPIDPDPAPIDPDGSPVWPWILGGCFAIGAGTLAIREIDKAREKNRTQGSLSWKADKGRFEGRLDYPATSQPFCLSIAVVPGSATHTLVIKAAGGPTERGGQS